MQETAIAGTTGIAHTRWATHGKPSELNAHPHLSHGQIALVHNGIIENHEKLRQDLMQKGYEFTSETDSEVAAHLIYYYFLQNENLLEAVQTAAAQMEGAFAIGVIHQYRPFELVAVGKGSPLVMGFGIGENFIASDALALQSFAQSVIYMEEGDCVILTAHAVRVYSADKKEVERPTHPLNGESEIVSKGPYRHFMLKEIFEQSKVLADTMEGRINSLEVLSASFGSSAFQMFPHVKQIHIVACGTSYHAGLIAKYWLESLAPLPTQVEIASEYRYRDVVVRRYFIYYRFSIR